jgi:hypothetical protein
MGRPLPEEFGAKRFMKHGLWPFLRPLCDHDLVSRCLSRGAMSVNGNWFIFLQRLRFARFGWIAGLRSSLEQPLKFGRE